MPRFLVALGVLAITAACGDSTAPTPSAPMLSFTITPNPVPSAGLSQSCENPAVPLKTWLYTLKIENRGTSPFTASSVVANWTAPGTASPIVIPADATSFFTRAFGSTSIPAQGVVQASLCAAGEFDSWSLTYTFGGVAGQGTFTTPAIQFQPVATTSSSITDLQWELWNGTADPLCKFVPICSNPGFGPRVGSGTSGGFNFRALAATGGILNTRLVESFYSLYVRLRYPAISGRVIHTTLTNEVATERGSVSTDEYVHSTPAESGVTFGATIYLRRVGSYHVRVRVEESGTGLVVPTVQTLDVAFQVE